MVHVPPGLNATQWAAVSTTRGATSTPVQKSSYMLLTLTGTTSVYAVAARC